MSRNVKAALIMFALIVMTNVICSPGSDDASSAPEPPLAKEEVQEVPDVVQEIAPEVAPRPAPQPPRNMCAGISGASRQQLEHIAAVQQSYNGIAEQGYAIRSPYHQKAWYVGVELLGPGMPENTFAVYIISGDKSSPGLINSVNNTAEGFSPVIPKGRNTRFETSRLDPEIKKLEDCFKSKK